MTQEDRTGVASPTSTVASRVREARTSKGWSAQQLADELRRAGLKWDRSIVANLETNRRAGVSVVELLVLAYVLDVAPVHLLVPLDEQHYLVTPEWITSAARVREWVRGNQPLPSTDPRPYFAQVPKVEWQQPPWTAEEVDAKSKSTNMLRALRAGTLEGKSTSEGAVSNPAEDD